MVLVVATKFFRYETGIQTYMPSMTSVRRMRLNKKLMIDRTSDPLSPLNSFGSIVQDLKIVLAQTSGIVDANELDVHLLSPESKSISKYAWPFIKFGEQR